RAVTACEYAGYPFVCVKATEVKEIDGLVVPTLEVSAGDLVRVQFLESGDPDRVSRRVLETAARFRDGRTFSPALVQTWRRNILRTAWIRPDSEQVVVGSEHQGLRFFVSTDRPNQTDLAAGYAAGERQVTGHVRVRFLNLLNTCRRLGAGWQSQAGRTSYELSYTEPWFLRSDLDVTVSARHTTADTSYSYTEVGAGGVVCRGALEIGIETGVDRVTGIDSLSRVRTAWVGTGIGLDLRDDPRDPLRGLSVELRTRAGQRVGAGGASLVSRTETDVEVLLPVGMRTAGAVGVAARSAVAHARLSEPELYRMGGANSLRGFREGQFVAPHLGWLNCELRFGLAAGVRVHPFFNTGIYSSGDVWRLAAGYGLGARWRTRIGRLGADYGIAVGDSPLRGKVHLSLATGF
ncbi:MAG: BamA/TamA family outer membrane protein, partial [candidate division WOR-3 bacterium]